MGGRMRRGERELSRQATQAVLERGVICHLAMVDGGEPYLVTVNYGYREGCLYFHCANQGRKLALLEGDGRVCFTVVSRHELVGGERACDYTMRYESAVGRGRARLLRDPAEKRRALGVIMAQYVPGEFDFPDAPLAATTVVAVEIDELTGKGNY